MQFTTLPVEKIAARQVSGCRQRQHWKCCRPFTPCRTGCDEIPQPTGDLQIENVASLLHREVTAEGD